MREPSPLFMRFSRPFFTIHVHVGNLCISHVMLVSHVFYNLRESFPFLVGYIYMDYFGIGTQMDVFRARLFYIRGDDHCNTHLHLHSEIARFKALS